MNPHTQLYGHRVEICSAPLTPDGAPKRIHLIKALLRVGRALSADAYFGLRQAKDLADRVTPTSVASLWVSTAMAPLVELYLDDAGIEYRSYSEAEMIRTSDFDVLADEVKSAESHDEWERANSLRRCLSTLRASAGTDRAFAPFDLIDTTRS